MSFHDQALPGDNHGPYRALFADTSARTGDAGAYTAQDVTNRVKALQLDTLAEYVLTGEGPTVWTALPTGGGGSGDVTGPGPSVLDGSISTYSGTGGLTIRESELRIIGQALCLAYQNETGSTIEIGEILKVSVTVAGEAVLATNHEVTCGVCIEQSLDGALVWVAVAGVCNVLVGSPTALGNYIDVGVNDGIGHDHDDPTATTFAQALAAKGSGQALLSCRLLSEVF